MPLQTRPVTQRRPRGARYNGPDHTWASEQDEAVPRGDVTAGLRLVLNEAKGVPARFVFVKPATAARGDERRVASLPSPQHFYHHRFLPGVRDEKMLEKLATHDVETVTTLFALADKCARAAEGRAWHSAQQTGVAQMGGSGAVTQDGKKKKKKNRGHERPQAAAPIIATATGGRNERNKRPRPQGGNSGSCPVHPNSRHSTMECREIIKLVKRVSERREQTSKDGSPPRHRPGKERVNDDDVTAGEWDLGYQSPEGSSRTSSPETLTPVARATATRSYTLCTAGARSSPPVGTSSPCAKRSCQRPQGSRRLLHISGGGAPLSPSGIRLPRQHGRGQYITAHHRPCHRQHAAAPCAD
jgi:hypothetical protein